MNPTPGELTGATTKPAAIVISHQKRPAMHPSSGSGRQQVQFP